MSQNESLISLGISDNSKRERNISFSSLLLKKVPVSILLQLLTRTHSTTTILISMSSTGLSPRPVAVLCIISTTSRPSSTSPNTVYWPSRWGVPPTVEYIFNCSSVKPAFPTLLSASAASLSCSSWSPARFLSRRICIISARCLAASSLKASCTFCIRSCFENWRSCPSLYSCPQTI